jgi:ABC-type transport system substrate-binding protein
LCSCVASAAKNIKDSIDIGNDGGSETRSQWKSEGFLLCCALIVTLVFSSSSSSNPIPAQDISINEPNIEQIINRKYGTGDYRHQALLSGEIDINDYEYWEELLPNNDPNIEVSETVGDTLWYIAINCREYPLNISGFRRAFAYAYDRTQVINEVAHLNSIKEQDSLVPYFNPFCIEDEFDWHYYEGNSSIGNQILDGLGFNINATTGFREAPNGDSFSVTIAYYFHAEAYYGGLARVGVQALESLHINAKSYSFDIGYPQDSWNPWVHGNMLVGAKTSTDYDLTWLASEFYSGNADDTDINLSGFSNSTFDGLCEQLLHSTQYDDVYEASKEMQEILHYNVPELVVYQGLLLHAYRTDKFTGFVEDRAKGIENQWTMLQLHKLDGTAGGVVSIGETYDVSTLNFFQFSNSILDNVHLSLFARGPNLELMPRLATSVTIETHSDNPAVTAGHTRFTFSIDDGQKWSDDTPVTADEVVFTFNYEFESGFFGNPEGQELGGLFAAYAPTLSTAVLEFSGESYWYFERIAFDYILPAHAFDRSPETWESWNPFLNSSEPLITCGPFIVSSFDPGESLVLQNRYYTSNSSTTESPTSSLPPTTSNPERLLFTIWYGVSIVETVIIVIFGSLSIRARRRINRVNQQRDENDITPAMLDF